MIMDFIKMRLVISCHIKMRLELLNFMCLQCLQVPNLLASTPAGWLVPQKIGGPVDTEMQTKVVTILRVSHPTNCVVSAGKINQPQWT